MPLQRFGLLLITWLALGASSGLLAQVPAPDLQCVVNDTLVWTPATVTCGPFVSYRVYRSANAEGPFSLLSEINTPETIRFYDANPNGELRYYYLESNHDCPGQSPLSSDTLDNRIPDPPTLRSIRVVDGLVTLDWEPSPSPETEATVVYRQTTEGTTPIATIPIGTTTYNDADADAQTEIERYFLTAVDACGSNSLFQFEYDTFFLTASAPDSCSGGVVLEGSGGPLNGELFSWSELELFVSVNGGPYSAAGLFPATGAFSYDRANDGENLCFYYETIQDNGARSRSSVACVDVRILQPIREIFLRGVTVVGNNSYELDWQWDAGARLTQARILKTDPSGNQTSIDLPLASLPVGDRVTYTDPDVDVNTEGYRYQIEAGDECGNLVTSNTLAPIVLGGQRAAQTYQLSWTPYSSPYLISTQYRLFRQSATGDVEIPATTETTGEDSFDPTDVEQQNQCYYVIAEVTLDLPGRGRVTQSVRSNVFCPPPTELPIYVPNAIFPESIYEENQQFRPFLGPYTVEAYLLQVFDRWGGLVFQSEDIEQGWDGTSAGEPLDNGSYFYFISLKTPRGEERTLRGTVNLLR